AYDAENHLTSVDNNTTALYVYDASGQRVAKGAGSALTNYYIYGPGGEVVSERDSGNSWIQSYIQFGDKPLGLYRGSHTGFYFRDHLNSTRLVTLDNQCVFDVM